MHKVRRLLPLLFLTFSLGLALPSQSEAQPVPPIQILSPGEGSQVTSPISLTARVRPGGDGLVRVTLTTRTGTVIARQLLRLSEHERDLIVVHRKLPYEVASQSSPAILTVATQDASHRPLSLRSVNLTLAQEGMAFKEEMPQIKDPWLKIISPQPGATLRGGQFEVQGALTPLTTAPIFFDLITDTGGVIGTSQLAAGDPGQPQTFKLALSYDFITIPRDVRLVIRQSNESIPTVAILDSLPLTLLP